jgi:choline dehydrogenase-like flavoprotein
MLIDARTIPTDDTVEADVCIIGAGAAGITLARELAGRPFRVCLLESGDLQLSADTQSLYAGENIGLPYFPLDTARYRFFGGATNYWGGTCRPFDPIDFEARPWVPYSGWPIQRSDLQPYYERARPICQVPSDRWDLADWRNEDPFPPLPLSGSRVVTRFAQVVAGARRSFGKVYRAEIERAEHVVAFLNANVTEIAPNEAASTVTSVRVACLSGNTFTVKARLFVLATGGIENARLLLLSNKTQPAGLGNQHDLVGRFFMDHPRFVAGTIIPANRQLETRFYDQHPVNETILKGYLSLSEETLRAEHMVDVQMRLSPIYDAAYHESLDSEAATALEYMVHKLKFEQIPDNFGQHLANVVDDLMSWHEHFFAVAPLPLPKPEVYSKIIQSEPQEREHLIAELLGDIAYIGYKKLAGSMPIEYIELVARIDPAPNPGSHVTLGSKRDQLGQRRVQLDWRLSPIDKRSVRRALEIVGMELGRAGLGRLQIGIDDSDTAWPADLAGGWHHMGTTRMSEDPRQGVVDKNCRVHGISNLCIAGSSVFPTAGSGTPTMTLVSLALRLADHIKEIMP